jgi:hypothetical protein
LPNVRPATAHQRILPASAPLPTPASWISSTRRWLRSMCSYLLEQVPQPPHGAAEHVPLSPRCLTLRRALAPSPLSFTDAPPRPAISVKFPALPPHKMGCPPPPHPLHGLRSAPQCRHGENGWATIGPSASVAVAERVLAPGQWCLRLPSQATSRAAGPWLLLARLVTGGTLGPVQGMPMPDRCSLARLPAQGELGREPNSAMRRDSV